MPQPITSIVEVLEAQSRKLDAAFAALRQLHGASISTIERIVQKPERVEDQRSHDAIKAAMAAERARAIAALEDIWQREEVDAHLEAVKTTLSRLTPAALLDGAAAEIPVADRHYQLAYFAQLRTGALQAEIDRARANVATDGWRLHLIAAVLSNRTDTDSRTQLATIDSVITAPDFNHPLIKRVRAVRDRIRDLDDGLHQLQSAIRNGSDATGVVSIPGTLGGARMTITESQAGEFNTWNKARKDAERRGVPLEIVPDPPPAA